MTFKIINFMFALLICFTLSAVEIYEGWTKQNIPNYILKLNDNELVSAIFQDDTFRAYLDNKKYGRTSVLSDAEVIFQILEKIYNLSDPVQAKNNKEE